MKNPTSEIFLKIVLEFTDLKWMETRDDLILKTIKTLRVIKEGKEPSQKLTSGLQNIIPHIMEFANSHPDSVENLTDSLGQFLKAPAPCKVKMINLIKTLEGGKA
jgi:hypothetical protein